MPVIINRRLADRRAVNIYAALWADLGDMRARMAQASARVNQMMIRGAASESQLVEVLVLLEDKPKVEARVHDGRERKHWAREIPSDKPKPRPGKIRRTRNGR